MTLFRSLYFWIIVAFIAGCILGITHPDFALTLEPLGSYFITLIKCFITPIVFITIILGIARTGSLNKLGRVGIRAFIYFEIVSTVALLLGWFIAVMLKPGAHINAHVSILDNNLINKYVVSAQKLGFSEFTTHLIPSNLVDPFINGDLLQIIIIAFLVGVAFLKIGKEKSAPLLTALAGLLDCFFEIIKLVMYLAPLGVLGAMSFAMAKFGGSFLLPLLKLVATFYLTGFVFIFIFLGSICLYCGFNIFYLVYFLLKELIIVLGTSSSEAALPQLMEKLTHVGCHAETVGLVVPLGYSFNLDGTNIYITLSALFIAQALGVHLSFLEQLAIFATALVSSKGAAGVVGAGFITLAATLSVIPTIPTVGIVLVLGIDRFMSDARALINFIGNAAATLIISCWLKEAEGKKLNAALKEYYLSCK